MDAPADVLLGWNPALRRPRRRAVRGLLAMLVHQYPVKLEVDESMVPLAQLVDEMVAAGHATVVTTTTIVATA